MARYIELDAVVAEINRLIAELVEKGEGTMFEQGRISAFEDAKLFLGTLEVKEVDLDAEITKWEESFKHCPASMGYKETAKHFFELGLKAQKGEKIC